MGRKGGAKPPIEGEFSSDTLDDFSFDTVDAWLSEGGYNDDPMVKITGYLYEVRKDGSSEVITKFNLHTIPDVGEIAERFGAGTYRVSVNIYRPKLGDQPAVQRCKYKIVHVSEKAVRAASKAEASTTSSAIEQIEMTLGLVERMFEKMVRPLMDQATKDRPAAAPSPVQDISAMSKVYSEMSSNMSKIMLDSMRDSMALRRDMLSMIPAADLSDDEPDTEPEPESATPAAGGTVNPLVERIIPLIEQFLPALIGNPAAAAVAPLVKGAPDFQKLMSDPESLGNVAVYVAKTYGMPALKEMVGKLGIPEEVVQVAEMVLGGGQE